MINGGRERYVHPGLTQVRRRALGLRFDAQQLSRGAAVHVEHRGQNRRVGDSKPVQQHRNGIHQHAAVLGDHLQRRTEPRGIVRPIDGDTAFTGRAVPAKPIMCAQHGGRQQGGWKPTGLGGLGGFRRVVARSSIAVDVGLRDPVRNVRTRGERGPRLNILLSPGIDRHADCSQLTTGTARFNFPAPGCGVPDASSRGVGEANISRASACGG